MTKTTKTNKAPKITAAQMGKKIDAQAREQAADLKDAQAAVDLEAEWKKYRKTTDASTRIEQAEKLYRDKASKLRPTKNVNKTLAALAKQVAGAFGIRVDVLTSRAATPAKKAPKAKAAKKYYGDGKMAIAVTTDGKLIVGARKIEAAVNNGKTIAATERAYVRAIQCARWAFKVRKGGNWQIGRACDIPANAPERKRFVYGSAK